MDDKRVLVMGASNVKFNASERLFSTGELEMLAGPDEGNIDLERLLDEYDATDAGRQALEARAAEAKLIIDNGLKHGLVGGTRNERRIAKKLAKKVMSK